MRPAEKPFPYPDMGQDGAGAPPPAVIATAGPVRRWIEPWYGAYAILGALASGFATILIPLEVVRSGGSAAEIGLIFAGLNVGALSAPAWGWLADRGRAYRAIFFAGFLLIALGYAGFGRLTGAGVWIASAVLIGLGIGASNTVASLFVVEFTPQPEWHGRISWLQMFYSGGAVLGLAASGVLAPRTGMYAAALAALLGIVVGRSGLPVPGGAGHVPLRLRGEQIARLLRHGGPNAAQVHLHRWRPADLVRLVADLGSPFGVFLAGWFTCSMAVSAFFSFYPVLMTRCFAVPVGISAAAMSVATAASLPLFNLAGRFSARRGADFVLRAGYAGRAATLAGLAILAWAHPGFAFAGALVLYAVFQGAWPLLGVAGNELAAALATGGEGPAIGLFNAIAAIAAAVGAVAGGCIAQRFGYGALLAFAALGVAASLVLARRAPAARPAPAA